MSLSHNTVIPRLFESDSSLNDRLSILHDRILAAIPAIDRIAVALYEASEDKQ